MNKISNLLTQFGYKHNVESRTFKENEIRIYTTLKYSDNEKRRIVAKYLIFDCADIHFNLVTDNFEYFQKEFIADIFFSHRDDIRWNIYAFIIVDNKEYIQKEGFDIEKDEDYARKFIFNLDDLKDFLQNGYFGKMHLMEESKIKTNFVLEWDKLLSEYSLNGCIYNRMNQESINDYINDGKPIRPIGRPLKHQTNTTIENDYIIRQIDKLQLSHYRTHCFNESFTYSLNLVNLISGTNGSGKSSICEAIALGMSSTNTKSLNDEEIKITCKNGMGNEIVLSSIKSNKESRELDLTWYGTTTTGSKSRLSENFTIFNYLKPNAIYNNDRNINELMQNLIYGEETTQAWQNIQNYKEKINTHKKNLKNSKTKIEEEIDKNNKSLDSLDKPYLINEIPYKDKYNILSEIPEKYSNSEKLDMLCSIEYSVSILNFEMSKFQNLKNIKAILSKKYKLEKDKSEIMFEKDQVNICEDKKVDLLLKKSTYEMNLSKLLLCKNDIENLNRKYFSFNYKEIDTCEEQKNFIEKYYQKQSVLNKLKQILDKYESLKYHNINYDNDLHNSFEEANIHYNKLVEEHENVKLCLAERRNNCELTKKILTDILVFAKKFQSIYDGNTICPLCGYDYHEPIKMEEAIHNTSMLNKNMDLEMQNLINLEYVLSKKIIDAKDDLEVLERKRKILNDINEFIYRIQEMDIIFESNVISEVYNHCIKYLYSIEEFISRKKEVIHFISEIENQEIFLEFKKQISVVRFSEYLRTKFENLNYEINDIVIEKTKLESEISDIEIELLDKSNICKSYDKIVKQINILEEIIANAYNVKSIFKIFYDDIDIKDWCRSFYNLKQIFEENLKREVNNEYKKSILNTIFEKKSEMEIFEIRLKRCNDALKAFETLSSLEDNMSLFIEENAIRIERIFKLIHRPEEFSNLVIEKGTIKFKRKTTGEIIDINQISTGQAFSLVFAITLCLHFSAPNSPNILMLDEPVANLDDVHIMNLLDMLREISMMGVQLVVTTANDQVAKYFRRKFSCLIDDFKHLDIERSDENPAVFKEKTYLPNKETPNVKVLNAV